MKELNVKLEKDISRIKSEIKLSGITLSPDLANDVVKIMNENQFKFTPFVKLFWEQQKAAFKKKSQSCTLPHDDCLLLHFTGIEITFSLW